MSLLKVIKEQSAFSFTGKINISYSSSGQFWGVIYMSEGSVVCARWQDRSAQEALFKIILSTLRDPQSFRYQIEPEIIPDSMMVIKTTPKEIEASLAKMLEKAKRVDGQRPPDDLSLELTSEIFDFLDWSVDDFDTMILISRCKEVKSIYERSDLDEEDVTQTLVKLRGKSALRVLKKRN